MGLYACGGSIGVTGAAVEVSMAVGEKVSI